MRAEAESGEVARFLALLIVLLSLAALFHTVFLDRTAELATRWSQIIAEFALCTVMAITAARLFRGPLLRTLPMQVFLWSTLTMALLLAAQQYLANNMLLYRDPRWL